MSLFALVAATMLAPQTTADPALSASAPTPAGGGMQIAAPSPPPLPQPQLQPQPQAEPPAPTAVRDPALVHDDVVVRARTAAPLDPLRALNAQSFAATQAVDRAFVGPVSLAYKRTVPGPFRSGVRNVLYNLREPVVFVNFLLQHKIGKSAETFGRFGINTVAGLAGLFDIAKRRPFHLPRRGNGFADTLGFYGVPNGPFLFLPLVGPTTVRDLLGGSVDRLVLPLALGNRITRPEVAIPLGVLGALDHRAEFDETLHTLHDGVPDPYANSRAFYLQRRQAEIDHLRGRDTGNSTPMSIAPTGPIRLRGVHPAAPPAPTPTPTPGGG